MRQKQILAASLGALAATGLAVYLVRRRKRTQAASENEIAADPIHEKNRSRAFNKSKALMYEPDDHPE